MFTITTHLQQTLQDLCTLSFIQNNTSLPPQETTFLFQSVVINCEYSHWYHVLFVFLHPSLAKKTELNHFKYNLIKQWNQGMTKKVKYQEGEWPGGGSCMAMGWSMLCQPKASLGEALMKEHSNCKALKVNSFQDLRYSRLCVRDA